MYKIKVVSYDAILLTAAYDMLTKVFGHNDVTLIDQELEEIHNMFLSDDITVNLLPKLDNNQKKIVINYLGDTYNVKFDTIELTKFSINGQVIDISITMKTTGSKEVLDDIVKAVKTDSDWKEGYIDMFSLYYHPYWIIKDEFEEITCVPIIEDAKLKEKIKNKLQWV